MRRLLVLIPVVLMAFGCSVDTIDAGGEDVDAGMDDDPLTIPDGPEDGSLDHIHSTIFVQRCSGVPGLCHNGQFEPNLSTPAMTYNYLTNRPSIEKPADLRVAPGEPDNSVLIDKLRDRDVDTMMPLGAEPLAESEIVMIEDWIRDGGLRSPGAADAPVLNNTPQEPEVGVYEGSTRLDAAGPFNVDVGTTLTLRHSVQDFETPDDEIPFALMFLQTPDGLNVVVNPANPDDPGLAQTVYDAAGPMGNGDLLNYRFDWTVPATVDLVNDDNEITPGVSTSGMSISIVALYIDEDFGAPDIMAAFTFGTMSFTIN